MTRDERRRWIIPAIVAGCCLATLIVKFIVNQPRSAPGHGDVSFYYTVAKNLAEGRGFSIDYIWTFWADPQGIPTPSNVWWMPLVSIIAAVGMWLGEPDYASAQAATICFSSLLPIMVYLLGRDLFGSRRTGLIGALLSTTFHLFLGQPSAPISASPYVVLVPLVFWLTLRAAERPRLLFAVGAAVALAQLTRSDGLLLMGAVVTAQLLLSKQPMSRQALLRGAALLLAGYVLVMSPWWLRNLSDFGTLQPAASARALFLSNYDQWHALPESVTADQWLAKGWQPVLEKKAEVGLANLKTFATGMTTGAFYPRLAWDSLAVTALMVLSWVGLATTFRRRFAPVWCHVALEFIFYSALFTIVGRGSFRSAMYGLYPFLVLCAARGIELAVDTVALRLQSPLRERTASALLTCVVTAFVIGQYSFAAEDIAIKGESISELNRFYLALESTAIEPYGLQDAVFMTRDVHEFHAILGRRCVQIPRAGIDVIAALAARYGVTHLLLLGRPLLERHPGLKDIDDQPGFTRVLGPSNLLGRVVRIYSIDKS